jgi:COMPASS component SWD3
MDNSLLLAGCGDGYLRTFNITNNKMVYELNTAGSEELKLPVTSLRFRPETDPSKPKNIVLCAGSGGVIQHWHITSGKLLNTIVEHENQVYALDYRNDSRIFATGGKDFKVRVYDEATRSLISTMGGGDGKRTAGHSNRVFALRFHPSDENIFLSGGWDNTVQIWDIRENHAVKRIYGPHICGDSLDIDKNGTVLTGSWRPNNQLQLWDFATTRLIEEVRYPVDPATNSKCNLYTAQFNNSSGSLIAAGGSGANEAKIITREGFKRVGGISGLEKSVYCLTFSSDSKQCAIGGGDGKIYILNTK